MVPKPGVIRHQSLNIFYIVFLLLVLGTKAETIEVARSLVLV
jgi:hypothetical protein